MVRRSQSKKARAKTRRDPPPRGPSGRSVRPPEAPTSPVCRRCNAPVSDVDTTAQEDRLITGTTMGERQIRGLLPMCETCFYKAEWLYAPTPDDDGSEVSGGGLFRQPGGGT